MSALIENDASSYLNKLGVVLSSTDSSVSITSSGSSTGFSTDGSSVVSEANMDALNSS